MPSFIIKFIPYTQKLAVFLLSALILSACGGDSEGGGGGISGLSDQLSFSVINVADAEGTNADGSIDVSITLNNNDSLDQGDRTLRVQLQSQEGSSGVVGSLNASAQLATDEKTISDGSLIFKIYRGTLEGTGSFILSVLDDEDSLLISEPISYTIIGTLTVIDPEDPEFDPEDPGVDLQLSVNVELFKRDGTTPLGGPNDDPLSEADPGLIRATVELNGVVQSGAIVSFSSDLGVIAPLTAATNASGVAEVFMTAGSEEGASVITASATIDEPDLSGEGTVSFTTMGDDGTQNTPSNYSVDIRICSFGTDCTPYGAIGNELNRNVGNATVIATLSNSEGGNVEGIQFVFSLTDGVGELPDTTAITDSLGVATVTLEPGFIFGAGEITASAQPIINILVSDSTTFQSEGNSLDSATLELAICSTAIGVACTPAGEVGSEIDAVSSVYARATVLDDSGVVQPNTVVTFSLDNEIGALQTLTALTNASGEAEVVLSAGVDAGAGTVIGEADVQGESISGSQGFISLGGGQPEPFRITVDLCTGLADDVACSNTTVTGGIGSEVAAVANVTVNAFVSDFPVTTDQAGVLVEFSLVNDVGVLLSSTAITDANGIASVQLAAGDVSGAGIVVVNANPDGNSSITDETAFVSVGDAAADIAPFSIDVQICNAAVVSPTDVAGLCVEIGSTDNPITGASQGYAWATVTNDQGVAQSNQLVTFSLLNGNGILESTIALTDTNGEASVGLRAGVNSGPGTVTAVALILGENFSDEESYQSAGDGSADPFTLSAEICKGGSDINLGGCNDAPALGGAIYGDGNDPLNEADGYGFVTVLLTDDAVIPTAQSGVVVNFNLSGGGVLLSNSGVTDSNGLVVVQVAPGDILGAGILTITANPDGSSELTETINLSTLGDGLAEPTSFNISINILDGYPGGSSHGGASNPITTSIPGFVVASVTSNGSPLIDELVTFSVSNDNGILVQSTALSDNAGNAVVQLDPGLTAGAGTLTASVSLSGTVFVDQINFASSVTSSTPDTISLGVDWGQDDICEDLNDDGVEEDPAFLPLAIYVEDVGNNEFTIASPCQISGSNLFNTITGGMIRELGTGVTANIKVHLYNETSGTLFSEPVEVVFSSLCAEIEKATIGSSSTTTSTVTSVGGTASTTYLADGCVGEDTITATATVGSDNLAAQVTFNIEIPPVTSIEFLGAEPQVLALRGTGGASRVETSVLQFRIVGSDGNPSANRSVYLALANEPGGVSLDTNLATSNTDGIVEVTVTSGTVSGTLRVRAAFDVDGDDLFDGDGNAIIDDDDIVVFSDQLSISSGLADADGINLFAERLNPEAWDYPNETVEITASLNDRSGENVAIGTAIFFRSELGRIGDEEGDAVCYTDITGSCSVTWHSNGRQEVEYLHYDPTAQGGLGGLASQGGLFPGFDRKGRNVIYAFVQGEEVFSDANGNNVFDVANESFIDIGETFLDFNENGMRDLGNGIVSYLEPYIEFDGDGVQDTPDGLYNGVTCSEASLTAGHCADLVNISDSITMSVSTGFSRIFISNQQSDLNHSNFTNGDDGIPNFGASLPSSATYTASQNFVNVFSLITDQNGNAMPEGTVVTATASASFGIEGSRTRTIGSTSLPQVFSFTVSVDEEGQNTGVITIETATPKGNETSSSFSFVPEQAGCHTVHFAQANRTVDESIGTVTVSIVIEQPDFSCTDDIEISYFVSGISADNDFEGIDNGVVPVTTDIPFGNFTLLNSENYSAEVTFELTDDTDLEGDESMAIFIVIDPNDTSGAEIGTNNSYRLTITDND